MKLTIVALTIGLLSGFVALADDLGRGRYVGYIDQLQSKAGAPASLTVSNDATHASITLTGESARYFRLYEQDELKCAVGTTVSISLRFGTTNLLSDTNWSHIPMPPNPKTTDARSQRNALIQESLVIGGRERGGGATQVFEPANGSVIRLTDTFSIHWLTSLGAVKVALEIVNPLSGFSWRTNTSAGSGVLILPGLMPQMRQEQANGTAQFELRCQFDQFAPVTGEFSILSLGSEETLAAQLRDETQSLSDQEAPYHLVRAALFNRLHLFNEAADEYEAAVNSPGEKDSLGLLERLKEANELIGNHVRSAAIGQRIKFLAVQRQ